LKRLSVEA